MLGNGEQLECWIFSEPMNKVIPKFTKGQCITINVLDSSSTVFGYHGHTCIIRDVIEYEYCNRNWVGYFLDLREGETAAREGDYGIEETLWHEEYLLPIQECG